MKISEFHAKILLSENNLIEKTNLEQLPRQCEAQDGEYFQLLNHPHVGAYFPGHVLYVAYQVGAVVRFQPGGTAPHHEAAVDRHVVAVVGLTEPPAVAEADVGLKAVDVHVGPHHAVVARLHHIGLSLLVYDIALFVKHVAFVGSHPHTHSAVPVKLLLEQQEVVYIVEETVVKAFAQVYQLDFHQIYRGLAVQLLISTVIDVDGHQRRHGPRVVIGLGHSRRAQIEAGGQSPVLVVLEGVDVDEHVPVPENHLSCDVDLRVYFLACQRRHTIRQVSQFRLTLALVVTNSYCKGGGQVEVGHDAEATPQSDVVADGGTQVEADTRGARCQVEVQVIKEVGILFCPDILSFSRYRPHACNGC